jgi:hypothetical protein
MEQVTIETIPTQEPKTNRKKEAAPKTENVGAKINLPAEMSQKVQEALATLRERGYAGKAEDFLAILWDQVTDEWCEVRVEALTPDEFYLDATKQIPEVRQKLVDQAKKALLKVREGSN